MINFEAITMKANPNFTKVVLIEKTPWQEVVLYECEECFALVRKERQTEHEAYHNK